jgi:hypothetical protein
VGRRASGPACVRGEVIVDVEHSICAAENIVIDVEINAPQVDLTGPVSEAMGMSF